MATRWEDRRDYRDEAYSDRDRRDRGVVSRAGDEVRSWFGDDEAERRRDMDERQDTRDDRQWRDRMGSSMERGWNRSRSTMRDATDRDRDDRRGFAEWQDNDRPWGRSREPRSYYWGSDNWRDNRTGASRDRDYWTSERSFGDTSRYASASPSTMPAYEGRGEWNEMSYAGRGPRGYKRGDERIREDVCDRLTEDPRIDASDVEVQVHEAEVTLSGSVRTREEKHLTEHVVERIAGVREVNNGLKVRPPDEVLGTARSGASMLGLNETPPPEPTKNK